MLTISITDIIHFVLPFHIDGGPEDWAYRVILITTGIILCELYLKYVFVEKKNGGDDDRPPRRRKLNSFAAFFTSLTIYRIWRFFINLKKKFKNKK